MKSPVIASASFLIVLLLSAPTVANDRPGFDSLQGFGSEVPGWRLGPEREPDGYAIYRRGGRGWYRVDGHAVKIAGSAGNPWVINAHNRIYYWTGRDWRRMPGSALDIADGWAIGTDRRSGGYGIYRWNGRDWRRVEGGAVEIGGSYEHPWVINDRGERFVWNGREWDRFRGDFHDYRPGRYYNSFGSEQRERSIEDSGNRRRSDW